jgi:RNA polymerase sigma factor (sigma-70 family)
MDATELPGSQPCGGALDPDKDQPSDTTSLPDDVALSPSSDSQPDAPARTDEPLAELIATNRAAMLRRARRQLGGEEATVGRTGLSADDVVQEASINLLNRHRNPEGLSADSMHPGYTASTTKNTANQMMRDWRRELKGKAIAEHDAADDVAMAKDRYNMAMENDRYNQEEAARDDAAILAAIPKHFECLKPQERQVLLALAVRRIPEQQEIARRVDRSASWVSTAIRTLGRRLYQCIELGECPLKERP